MGYDWSELSFLRKAGRCLLIVFYSLSIAVFIIGSLFLLGSLIFPQTFDAEDRLISLWLLIIGAFLYPFCFVWWNVEFHKWKVRFLFPGRGFWEPAKEVLSHYDGFPDEAKILKKKCKDAYHTSGKLSGNETFVFWQSRDRDGAKYALALSTALCQCCQDGGGFEAFIKLCDNDAFSYFDRQLQKEVPMTNYQVGAHLCGIYSVGLDHLFSRVSMLCGFTLFDNGLNAAYTEKNEENRKKLETIYSPILFTYKDEIQKTAARLSQLVK